MTKIFCLIPTKGRPEVLGVTMQHMTDQIKVAERYGLDVTVQWEPGYKSSPLGEKLNMALQSIMFQEWDYLMVLGSDNLLRPQYWGYVRAAISEEINCFGFGECLLYDRINHKAKLWQHAPSTFGAGRLIHRSICSRCDWVLWDNRKENGIDNSQERRIYERCREPIFPIPTFRPVICDIKDSDNINSFDSIEGMDIMNIRALVEFPCLTKFYYAYDTKETKV